MAMSVPHPVASQESTFRHAMRRLASGVSLVTTVHDGEWHGLAATSVNSVTTAPPTLSVCINRSASCYSSLARSGVFCVNLLRQEDEDVALLFSRSEHRQRRFDSPRWTTLTTGAPALSGALASMDCEVVATCDVGSHTIFIGEIRQIMTPEAEIVPLVYLDGGYVRLAQTA